MKSLLALPHLPILLYLVAALVLTVGGGRISSRVRNVLAVCVCIAVGVILLMIRSTIPVDLVFSDWLVNLTLFGSLIYHVDYLNWTFAAILTLVVMARVAWAAIDGEEDRDARLAPGLLLLSAAVYSILFAGNLMTLLVSWTALMVASLILLVLGMCGTRAARRYLIVFGIAALVLLWATWDAGRGDGGRWASLALSQPAAVALFAVAWISLGAYPLHAWLPLDEGIGGDVLSLLYIAPSLIGLYLLARLSLLANGHAAYQNLWLALGAVALLMGAELAYVQRQKQAALAYVAAAMGGALILGASFPSVQSLYIILPWAVALSPAMFVLMMLPPRAGVDDPQWLDDLLRAVYGLASASLVGLPPTAGFIVWSQLENAVSSLRNPTLAMVLIALLAVSGGLIAATLFRFGLVERPQGRVRAGWQSGLLGVILLAPMLLVAVRPRWAVAHMVGGSLTSVMRLTDVALPAGLWTIALPVTLGFLLTWVGLKTPIDLRRPAWDRLASFWRLDWACALIEAVGGWLANILETVTDLVHGDHHLVWAFLVVLVFLWLYLFP